jgi:hypothetical protein
MHIDVIVVNFDQMWLPPSKGPLKLSNKNKEPFCGSCDLIDQKTPPKTPNGKMQSKLELE